MPSTQVQGPVRLIPAVNGAIISEKGKILLTRRSKVVREPGKWCLPGGHLEFGENWATAAAREVEEEVGIHVKAQRLFGIYSDPALTLTTEPVAGGFYAQFVCAAFLITDYEKEIQPNEEVDAWDWFSVDKLPEPILKSHPVRVRDAFAFVDKVFVR